MKFNLAQTNWICKQIQGGPSSYSPTAKKAIGLKPIAFFGGGWWIRTTEVSDNRFTVCPLWPLGKSPIWSWWSESNQQPADYKSAALPLSHTSIFFSVARWRLWYYTTMQGVCQHFFWKKIDFFKDCRFCIKQRRNLYAFCRKWYSFCLCAVGICHLSDT